MKYKFSIHMTLLYICSLYAAAEDYSLCFTQEMFLERIGLSHESISAFLSTKHSYETVDAFVENFANSEQVLSQDENHSAQLDFYTCMLTRVINEHILKQKHNRSSNVTRAHWAMETGREFNISLHHYYNDQELLGKAHHEIQKLPDLYDWLVEFRNAQRKEPLLSDRSRLYATLRELFISVDEAKRAIKLQELKLRPHTLSSFSISRKISALQDNKSSFKAKITSLEEAVRKEAHKSAQLKDILAAFDALTETK
jgi:hypothetical protein